MKKVIKVGTRQSKLAVTQTEIIINRIKQSYPELEFEMIKLKTKGDNLFLNERADVLGGKGLFVNELEKALLDHKIDLAVHSMKDMPVQLPAGLRIAAVSKREDPRDVLVTETGMGLPDLKEGAVIGTSSLRREVQLLSQRPDLQVKNIRGNVHTRLAKLYNKEYDGLILAAAGLIRLGLAKVCAEYFPVRQFIPAIGQGILCVETRVEADIDYLKKSVHDQNSALMLRAERAFMVKLNGGCSTPVAAYAEINQEKLHLWGMRIAGEEIIKKSITGDKKEAEWLGETLAAMLEK